MSDKGQNYEREISRDLSLWISSGKHDDLLWRSSQSGGRATTRAKSGKRTIGHASDLCATSSEAEWFTQLFTTEIKKGYPKASPFNSIDCLDRAKRNVEGTFEAFITQTKAAQARAGTPYWMLIHSRTRKAPMIYLPGDFWNQFRHGLGDSFGVFKPRVVLVYDSPWIGGVRLDHFLATMKPKRIKGLL